MQAGVLSVDLLMNDLSLHGQFSDVQSFHDAVGRIMEMRQIASRYGREVHCHRNIPNARATHGLTVLQATQGFALAERRVILAWLTKLGPFWDDSRAHSADDYLASGETIVTDTAVGEAAGSRISWCRSASRQYHALRLDVLADIGFLDARQWNLY